MLSRFLHTPENHHLTAAERILGYFNSNSLSITYGAASRVTFVGYSDSECDNENSDRKSVGRYICLINGKPITWSSGKYASVSLLSCEKVDIVLAQPVKEVIFIFQDFDDIFVLFVSSSD